jgi:nitrogen fixation protein FixH
MEPQRPRAPIEPWPWILAALLFAMVAGSLAFYQVARANPDPLVVDDAYAAGLHYSERVRAERRAEALGWEVTLHATPDPGGAHVSVALRDATGSPLEATRASLRRERPAEGGLDAEFALRPAGAPGRFEAQVPLPRRGRWRLVARFERGGETVERAFALELP